MSKMNKKDLYTHAKELKADLETQIFFNNTLEEEIEYMKDHQMENTKLKEENEKLTLQMTSMCSEQADSDCAFHIEGLEEEIENSDLQIEGLKEENQKLKEQIKQMIYDFDSDEKNIHYKKLTEENEKLKKNAFEMYKLACSDSSDSDSEEEEDLQCEYLGCDCNDTFVHSFGCIRLCESHGKGQCVGTSEQDNCGICMNLAYLSPKNKPIKKLSKEDPNWECGFK
tara:strand:+ start:85 stop:762 length:678 start_codon:yes stop_codon:yes gene_type:complete